MTAHMLVVGLSAVTATAAGTLVGHPVSAYLLQTLGVLR